MSVVLSYPFRTAVPFWGQTSQILSSLSPKRDCGSKGDNVFLFFSILRLIGKDKVISSTRFGCPYGLLVLALAVVRLFILWWAAKTKNYQVPGNFPKETTHGD